MPLTVVDIGSKAPQQNNKFKQVHNLPSPNEHPTKN
jgi:hypothetical protein